MSARLIQNVLAIIVIVSVFLSAASPVIARPADVRAPVSRAVSAPLSAMQQPSPLDALLRPNKTMPPNVSVPSASPASNPVPLPRHCDGVTPPGSDLPCCMYGYIYFNGQPVANAQVHIQSAHGYKDTFSAPGQSGGQPYFSFDLSSPPISATVGSVVTVTASYSGMVSSRTWVVQPNGQQVDLGLLAGASDRSTTAAMPQPDRPALARPSAVQATSVLSYSTFLGGSSDEIMHATYVDGAGNFYVTGYVYSSNFPTTPGAYDTSFNGHIDAFVAKFNASGALIYSTFLGGSGEDVGWGIYADEAGQIYVAGYTDSAVFPTTVGAYDTSPNGGRDVFVLKLNAVGTDLIYSTVIGGSGWDWPNGLVVNASGEVYFAGVSSGSGYPTTPGAYQSTAHGGWDAVVTQLNASGSDVIYSTFIGGGCDDYGSDPVLDASGAIYLKGWTCSSDFPVTPGAYDPIFGGGGYGSGGDGFVTKLNATGTTLIYSTYIGGSDMDDVTGFAVDLSGAAYAIGMTKSADFPTTAGAWDTVRAGESDAFVLKLNAAGNGAVYSTLVGGSLTETGWDGRVDASGQVTLVGNTNSSDFPVMAGAFDTAHNGGTCNNAPCFDFFATTLNAAGSNLIYSTYLGGSGDEGMPGVQRGSDGTVYLAGDTLSADYPVTAGAYDSTLTGGRDVVVTAWKPNITSPCGNCSITGRVTVAAAGLSGVSMAGSNGSIVTADGNGYYTFTTALTGTYTVTPTKLGYTFAPVSRTNSVPPAATGQDFAGTALPAEGEWVQVYPASTPPMRVYFAMAYDSDRQRTIIFGGQQQGGGCSQETWEYDGVNWAQVATTGPAARESATMVYDPVNQRVILFGGYLGCGSSTPSNDTWSYTPTTHIWTQLTPATSPAVRGGSHMTYDSGRNVVVVYGGWNGSYLGDTWEYSGTNWIQQLTPHSPVGRSGTALRYAPALGKVLLYGGYCDGCSDGGASFRNDMWVYDGADWTQIFTSTLAGARTQAAVDYDTARNRLVVFGGWMRPLGSNVLVSDTWEYDGSNWHAVSTAAAPAARITSMVYDAARGRFVLYGGYDGSGYRNDTWEYVPANTTYQVSGQVIDDTGGPLAGVVIATSSGKFATTTATGQYTLTGLFSGTVWLTPTKTGYVFVPGTRSITVTANLTGQNFSGVQPALGGHWVQVTGLNPPPMRVYFAMAYDSDRQRTIIFGGQKQGQVCSQETWEYDGVNWTQVATTGPAARESARMVYDPINHRVILFGGYLGCGSSTPSNDTWSYNPATHVWTQLTPATSPGVRGDFQLAYDGGRQTIVLFGGWNGSYLGDTWEFNGTNWVPKSPAHSPVGRAAAALKYLPSLGKVVLYGGYCDGQCADSGPGFRDELWAYDGTDWTLISHPTGTGSRAAAAVDVDTARGRLMVFGGWEGPWLSDHLISETWEYNGVNWWQIATPLAPTARFTSMVYDAARGRFVLYGGYDGSNYLNDTWEYIPAAFNPAPMVDFQGLPLSGSAPLQVQFSEQVQGRVTAWTWHFGDGGLSGARYPTYIYDDAGLYDVSLTVAGPDGLSAKTRTAYVSVYLTARFDAAPKSGTAPLTVAFVNQSTGNITSWLWNFGDGSFSSTPNPTHTYSVPGVYTVTLSVSSPGGSAGVSKPNLITVAAPSAVPLAWTVMLYMAGDNNANDPMLEALEELEQIPDNLNANVVVLHDGYYNNDTRLYHITSYPESGINSLPVAVGWNPGEMDMGDPQTLIEFVNWARAEYPAQHYLLSILDHGRGTTGLAQDDTNGHDLLTAYTELRAALNTVTTNGAKKIDVVYFDTCLMGMIEDAYQLRGLADYMVASENLGWSFFPYQQHVQAITAATSPRQLAQALADTYFGSGPLPRTVAAIDLAAVAQTGAAIGNLGQALHTYLQNGGNPWAIFNARENVQVFDSRDYGVLTSNDEYVDIYHLAQRLATEVITDTAVQTAAQAVLTATQQAVVVEHHQSGWALGNYWNLDNAHGLSIYFPRQSGGWDYYNYVNPQVVTTTWQFTSQTLWDEFLRRYFLTGILPPDPPDGFDGLGEVQIPHYGIYLPLVRR